MTDPLHQILSDIGGLKAEAAASASERRLLFEKLDAQNVVLATHGRMLAEIKASLDPLSASVKANERKVDVLEAARHRVTGARLAAGAIGGALTTAAGCLMWIADKVGWIRVGGN